MSFDGLFSKENIKQELLPWKRKTFIEQTSPGSVNTVNKLLGIHGQDVAEPPPIPEQVKPVSMTTGAVTDANVAARRAAKKRKGMASTILAGETLAGETQQSPYGQKTLLGGG